MQKHNKIYPATNDVVFKKIFGEKGYGETDFARVY